MIKFLNQLILLFFLFAGNVLFAALDAPVLRCISINNSGDVTIDWDPTTGPGPLSEFRAYNIYRATNIGGPYTLLLAVNNINNTIYTDIAASPALTQVYYYIETIYDDGAGPTASATKSDTLEPIILDGQIPTYPFGILQWNAPRNPLHSGNAATFELTRRPEVAGTFTPIANVPVNNVSYTDTIYSCGRNMLYRISLQNVGCASQSNIDTIRYEDTFSPNNPRLDSVSIDRTTGALILGFSPSNSPDAIGYIMIYQLPGSPFVFFDTVYTTNPATYVFPDHLNFNGIMRATISPIDSCGNTRAAVNAHSTIFLEGTPNLCEGFVDLNWTPYEGWNQVTSYSIYYRKDSGNFVFLNTVNASTFAFRHQDIDLTARYDYLITAEQSAGIGQTSSNIYVVDFNLSAPPRFHQVNYVDVLPDGTVEVEVFSDISFELFRYQLSRSTVIDGDYIKVAETEPQIDSLFYMRDNLAKTNAFAYYYRADIVDSCNQIIFSSNISRSILLSANYNRIAGAADLNWTGYSGWTELGSAVRRYRLWRKLGDRQNFELIDSAGVSVREISNLIFDETSSSHRFCYYIEAISVGPNNYLFLSNSTSNIVCIEENTEVWIPDMFTPNKDGINEIFRPIGYFTDTQSYLLEIYDRWGTMVWSTNDPLEGWDGEINGEVQPTGVYAYRLQVISAENSITERRGAVKLIK